MESPEITKLYVGGIAYTTTESQLEAEFGIFGKVTRVQIIRDRMTGRSKGFGFVDFADQNAGTEAVEALDGVDFEERQLTVSIARPQTPKVLEFLEDARTPDVVQKAADLANRLRKLQVDREVGRKSLSLEEVAEGLVDIAKELQIPAEYSGQLVTVNHLPISVLQMIASDPRAMHSLAPRQFEQFIAELISQIGFQDVVLTPGSHDGGKDIVARLDTNGGPITFFFECKKYSSDRPININTVRSFFGVVSHHAAVVNKGVLVTTSRFTKNSLEFISADARLDGKDYDGIVGWLDQYGGSDTP